MDKFEAEVLRLNIQQPWADPFWQGGPFQLCARSYAVKVKRFILSLDKGLGKTSICLSLFEDPEVNHRDPNFSVIIVTTKKGMRSFTRDIKMFPEYADKVVLIKGTKAQRYNLWRKPGVRYFVVTYAGLLSDTGNRTDDRKTSELSTLIVPGWVIQKKGCGKPDAIVCDEFHRAFRNRTSGVFKMLKSLSKGIEYFIPMSGSTMSKGPQDIWAALHLCDPKFWSSYWKYVYTWCIIDDSGFGKTIIGPRTERVALWRAAVRGNLWHATAEDVAQEIPPIKNYPLDVELPDWQRDIHDQFMKGLIAETPSGEYIFAKNRLSALYKIRLTLICPKVLNPELGVGIGIESIVDDVEELDVENCPRYAIFTPFRDPIPFLAEYIESRGHKVWIMWGGISLEEQEKRITEWANHYDLTGERACIISTIKYAESWEIPQAWLGYMLGYEWDNEDNDQARKRLRRYISTRPVMIPWVRHVGTYDEEMLSNLMVNKDAKDAMLGSWNTASLPEEGLVY